MGLGGDVPDEGKWNNMRGWVLECATGKLHTPRLKDGTPLGNTTEGGARLAAALYDDACDCGPHVVVPASAHPPVAELPQLRNDSS